MELQTERFRDYPTEPVRALMEDGVWLVPPEQRPQGWQQMGIKEPEQHKPAPSTTLSKAPVPRSAYERWGETVRNLLVLTDGASFTVPIPQGENPRKFKNNLNSILHTKKGCSLIRWKLRQEDNGAGVQVTRIGPYKDVLNTRRQTEVDQEIARAQGSDIETTPDVVVTTEKEMVQHRTETTTITERQTISTAPVPTPAAVRSPFAERFAHMQHTDDTAKRVCELVRKIWNPHNNEFNDQDYDELERLGERLRAERDASCEVDQIIRVIEDELGEKLSDVVYGAVSHVLEMFCTEKRLLEYEVFRYCKHLRLHGDPVGADCVEELLPYDDRKKLHPEEK